MKKNVFIVVVIFLGITTSFAQIERETLYFGVSAGLTSNEPTASVDRFDAGYPEISAYEFTPYFGMFFWENFLFGVSFPLKHLRPYPGSDDMEFSVDNFMVSPFAKYYFDMFDGDEYKLVIEGSAGYGIHAHEESVVLAYKLGAGVSYFITEKISIDLCLHYSFESKEPTTDNFYLTGYKEVTKGFEPSVGVYFYFF